MTIKTYYKLGNFVLLSAVLVMYGSSIIAGIYSFLSDDVTIKSIWLAVALVDLFLGSIIRGYWKKWHVETAGRLVVNGEGSRWDAGW